MTKLSEFDVSSCIAATLAKRLKMEWPFGSGDRLYFIFWKLKMFLAEKRPGVEPVEGGARWTS
jgi:hypothetical protein